MRLRRGQERIGRALELAAASCGVAAWSSDVRRTGSAPTFKNQRELTGPEGAGMVGQEPARHTDALVTDVGFRSEQDPRQLRNTPERDRQIGIDEAPRPQVDDGRDAGCEIRS